MNFLSAAAIEVRANASARQGQDAALAACLGLAVRAAFCAMTDSQLLRLVQEPLKVD